MKKHFFINRGTSMDPVIYLDDNILLGGFNEMLVYIFCNFTKGSVYYSYTGFSKLEINGINLKISEFCNCFNEKNNYNNIDKFTHVLKIKATDKFFLDDSEMLLKVLSAFRQVDSIEYKIIDNKKQVIVKGIKILYGILCDEGFYSVETDEFFENNCFERNEIGSLKIHYVSKSGIVKKKTIYKS